MPFHIRASMSKAKVYVYSPYIPVDWADFTLFSPRYWNSYSLISLGRIQSIFCSSSQSHSTNFHSTWYSLLLGGQRRCGFRVGPRLYTWPALRESNPRPLDLRSSALTIRPRAPNQCTISFCLRKLEHVNRFRTRDELEAIVIMIHKSWWWTRKCGCLFNLDVH